VKLAQYETRWPKVTYPGLIHRLTNLQLLDFNITVNVDPLPVRKEIAKEEKEHDRIAGDYASEKKLSLLTVMEKKQKKIHALMQGHTLPFNVNFAVRTWDKTKEGLCAKTNAIKNAINSMNSAQYYEATLASTSKNLFFQTWPGWTWGKYEARKLYGEKRIRRSINQLWFGIPAGYRSAQLPDAIGLYGNRDIIARNEAAVEQWGGKNAATNV
jgi:hypothetical protein